MEKKERSVRSVAMEYIRVVTVLAFSCGYLFTAGLCSVEETGLISDLLTDYNKLSRPVIRDGDAVGVKLNMSLRDMIHLDENTGHVSVRLWLKMSWKDEFLQWNPLTRRGIKRLYLSSGNIWVPDVTLYNSVNTEKGDGLKLTVHYNGTVLWTLPVTYNVICPHEFRHDAWVCVFRFGSWVYPVNQMDIHPFEAQVGVYVEEFSRNDYWGILSHKGWRNVSSSEEVPFASLTYVVQFRKRMGPSLLGRPT